MQTAWFTRVLVVAAASGGLALVGCGSPDRESASSTAVRTPVASTPTIGTPAGDFAVNQAAEIAFTDEAGVASDEPILVQTRITRITRGRSSDLMGSDGSAPEETPYYVSASFKNLSDVDFDPKAMIDSLGTTVQSGGPARPITIGGGFSKCDQRRPSTIAAGDTIRICSVFLAPKGETLDAVWRRDRFGDTWSWSAG